MQPSVVSKRDQLEDNELKLLFEAANADGIPCLEWSRGVVTSVVNRKT